jgi:hypothetical protein
VGHAAADGAQQQQKQQKQKQQKHYLGQQDVMSGLSGLSLGWQEHLLATPAAAAAGGGGVAAAGGGAAVVALGPAAMVARQELVDRMLKGNAELLKRL